MTATRTTEKELKILALVARHTNNAIIITDEKGKTEWVNDAFEKQTGYTLAEIKGKKPGRILQGDKTSPDTKKILSDAVKNKKPVEVEILNYSKSGEEYWQILSIQPVPGTLDSEFKFIGVGIDVTDRKKIEQRIIESELRFRALFNNTYQFIGLLETDGTLIEANKTALEFGGFTLEQAKGMKFWEAPWWSLSQETIDDLKNAIKISAGGKFIRYEVDVVGGDGQVITLDFSLNPVKDENGNVVLLIPEGRDISENKKAQLEIVKQQKLLNEAQKIANLGSWEWDLTTDEILWSDELYQIFGIDPKEFKADFNSYINLLNKSDAERINELIKNALSTKLGYKISHSINLKDGTIKYVDAIANLELDNSGNVVRLFGTVLDVTERKQAEKEIRLLNEELEKRVKDRTIKLENAKLEIEQSREELRTINNRLELAFSAGGHAWWEWDYINGKVISSPLKYKMLGFEYDEIEPNIDWWINRIHPDDKEKMMQNLRNYVTGETDSYDVDYRQKHKNNSYVWFHDRGKISSYTDDNKPLKLVGTVQDISIVKEAEQEIINSKTAAEDSNRAKSEFLANMSHEIRTPMNSIIGFTDILGRLIKEPKQLRYLDSIKSSGEGLLTLINDILDLSKVEAGKIDLQPRPLNLSEFVEEIRLVFAPKTEEKEIEFLASVEAKLEGYYLFDEVRLRQILFNLLGNAVKFTNSGSIELMIMRIDNNKDDNMVDICICIKDTGIGIDPDQQSKIFESFVQQEGQDTRKYEGTGLGLAITKRLVELMDGEIIVKSELGKGSNFIVNLYNVQKSEDTSAENLLEDFDITAYDFSEMRVLAVDDIQTNLDLIEALLEGTGAELHFAHNGKEALDLARKTELDLILMDLKMPVMDGYAATRQIREIKGYEDKPIIALTASGVDLTAKNLKSKGFSGLVLKPISTPELFCNLAGLLIKPPKPSNEKPEDKSIQHNEEVTIPAKEMKKLIQLLSEIRDRKWVKAIEDQMIDETSEFVYELKQVAAKYPLPELFDYTGTLEDAVNSFDIIQIQNSLNKYPELMTSLTKYKS